MTRRMAVMLCSGVSFAFGPPISVLTHPGLMTTQLMPRALRSIAAVRIAILTAAFDVRYAIEPPEVLSASYDEAYQAIDKDGALTETGIQAQLADLAKTDPRAKTAHPSDFFDASIINELHKEGFVKALWANK